MKTNLIVYIDTVPHLEFGKIYEWEYYYDQDYEQPLYKLFNTEPYVYYPVSWFRDATKEEINNYNFPNKLKELIEE